MLTTFLAGRMPADGMFGSIVGLPLHPLAVHAAVVLLPLSALGLIAIVLVKRWRGPFGWLTMAGLAVATGSAFLAKESGEALAAQIGTPQRHADLGDVLPLIAAVMFVVAAVWFVLQRRAGRTDDGAPGGGPLVVVLGIAAVVMAVVTIVMTVLVGHSGAEAVWKGRVPSASSSESGGTGTSSGDSSASGGAATAITMTDVSAHATPADCWTVINGTVYDLTGWIDVHPGGARDIEQTCGIDATAAFEQQHSGQREPAEDLGRFAIGTVSNVASAGPAGAFAVTQASFTPVTSAPSVKRYSMAQVRRHSTPTNCWSVVNRRVYNLTGWINRHPGGASRIIGMCGTDASRAFNAQHGGSSQVASYLRTYRIGVLR